MRQTTGRPELTADSFALAASALAALAVCALYSGIVRYVHNAFAGPKPLYVILAVVAGAAALVAMDPHRSWRTLRAPVLIWAYAYLLLSTVSAVVRPVYSPLTDQGLIDRYRAMAFLAAAIVVFDYSRARKVAAFCFAAVALLSSLVNVGEVLGLVKFNDTLVRVEGRSAGFYANSNQSGLAIVVGLAASIPLLPRPLRVPLIALCAGGVAATFSRSSMVLLTLLVLLLVWRREIGIVPTAVTASAMGIAVLASGDHLQRLLESSGVLLNQDIIARLTMRAGDSGRAALAAKVWQMFLDAPWFGRGIATEMQGRISHNMYVSLAAEHGVLGLAAYPAFLLSLVVKNRAAVPIACVLFVAGFFSHNILEEESTILCVAAVAALGQAALTRPADEFGDRCATAAT